MRLLDWRKSRNKKQAEIAAEIGVQVSQLSKIERGETFVSPATGEKIKTLTEGAVGLDDLHDQWREYQSDRPAKSGAAA